MACRVNERKGWGGVKTCPVRRLDRQVRVAITLTHNLPCRARARGRGGCKVWAMPHVNRQYPQATLNIQKKGDGVGAIKSLQPQASRHPAVPHAEKKSPFAKYSNQQMTAAPAGGLFFFPVPRSSAGRRFGKRCILAANLRWRKLHHLKMPRTAAPDRSVWSSPQTPPR